ncbi:hypothetical protein YC2023_010222 [Brassica napus]
MIDCSSRPQPEVFKVNEIVIFVGKVEVEVGKEGNSHCCFTSGSGANQSRDSEIARALTDGEDTSGRE